MSKQLEALKSVFCPESEINIKVRMNKIQVSQNEQNKLREERQKRIDSDRSILKEFGVYSLFEEIIEENVIGRASIVEYDSRQFTDKKEFVGSPPRNMCSIYTGGRRGVCVALHFDFTTSQGVYDDSSGETYESFKEVVIMLIDGQPNIVTYQVGLDKKHPNYVDPNLFSFTPIKKEELGIVVGNAIKNPINSN